MGATAPPPSRLDQAAGRGGRRRSPAGCETSPTSRAATPPGPGAAPQRPAAGRGNTRRGREMNRETRMANGESQAGADAPAGGFVQLLTPDGERVDSVTTADGVTYSV